MSDGDAPKFCRRCREVLINEDEEDEDCPLSLPARPDTAPEKERVALWMIAHSYATGYGDTVEDMLGELEWQAIERGQRASTLEHEAMDKGDDRG
jgi:hypothetical protein